MRSLRERLCVFCLLGASMLGCGLDRPADPIGLDCSRVDRAAERFPDSCDGGIVVPDDAGPDDAGPDDAGP